MKKVITYGSYDFLHYGHVKLLERAKDLGDYLIVGVTSDDFDRKRGKINVQQSLAERIENVRKTGLADEIIVEEYIGQKIDDIKRYDIDIFTVGSDWIGKFDYLKEYCEVVYLPRTEGISSTKIRSEDNEIIMGLVGDDIKYLNKYKNEDKFVNGINIFGLCTNEKKSEQQINDSFTNDINFITNNLDNLLDNVDAIYINSSVEEHYNQIKKALEKGKHVLCESPICDDQKKCMELFSLAKKKNVVLMDAMRLSCSMAYSRLLLLIKGGEIGNVVAIDSTITNMEKYNSTNVANSFINWGAQALLPILDILGCEYKKFNFYSKFINNNDIFTKLDLLYDNAIGSLKVAEGAKSEGELIITGTDGYIIVPAPWWKPDYFEIRYENPQKNKRYFYQLDGEGIRYQLLAFIMTIKGKKNSTHISNKISIEICNLTNKFKNKVNMHEL